MLKFIRVICLNFSLCVDLFYAYISDWSGEESTYISTRATQYVINTLSSGNCVTVTGCPGSGKSAIIHHVALHYQREMDYEIIPVVNSPFDLKNYNNPLKNQVFILDNVFGTITVNCQAVDTWLSNTDMIEKILSMGSVKLLIACRLHILNDPLFKRFKVLIPNQCNLHTDEFCLLENERVQIAQKYLDEHEIACISDILNVYTFFPLLCKLYSKDKYSSIRSFFENPVEAFKQNIEAMRQDSNKVQYCAFTMCVLFKDLLREDWFERNDENATNMVSVCEEFGLDYRLERKNLKQQLDALENTYVKKLENRYSVIHDKLYDVAAVECGQDMLGCFIDYADVTFIGDRYLIEGVDTDSDDTVIKIPAKHERRYFQRLLCDLKQGNIYSTFQNRQLQYALYREKLLSFLTDTANSSLVQSCLRKFEKIHLDNINLHEEEIIDYPFSQSDDEDSDHLSDVSGDSNSDKDVKTLLSFSCKSSAQNNIKVDIPLPLLESSSLGHDDIVNMLIEMGCKVNIRDNYCRSALFNASLNGHYRVVQTLLRNRADALQCDKWERSPLYVACEKGHVETVKSLLEESDITKCDSCFFKSPLHVACEKGNTKIVQMLLEYGSHISDINSDGHSPLYIACEFGHLVLVHLLLDYHADINQRDEKNSTPLLIACMNGHFEIVKLLIENRADIAVCNSDGLSPLHVASKWGKTEVVKVLLQTNSNVNLQDRLYGRTPLFLACEGRHEDIIQLLVRKGCNILTCDARKQSPLYVACKTGQTNTVKIFLDHMTDNNVLSFNYSDWSPLIAACEGGYTSIVKMLVERNIYLNVRDDNNKGPLHICCEKGFTDIVRLLLYHECEINCLNGDHQTALFIASENGFSKIVSLLLDNNADPNITDEEDWSPFHVACHEGHTDVVKVLLQYNAETMKCNNDRLPSPLVVASRNGHADVVQLLLTNNADPNQSDTRKWSPLHFACKAGYTDVVRLLLQYGANPTLRNNGGRCPVDLARSSFHNDVIQIIEEYLTNRHFPSVDQNQA